MEILDYGCGVGGATNTVMCWDVFLAHAPPDGTVKETV